MLKYFMLMVSLLALTFTSKAFAVEPTAQAESLLTSIVKNDIDEGFNHLFSGTELIKVKPQALDLLKAQTKTVVALFGQPIGFEKVTEKLHGKSVVRLVYLLKTEKHPLVWEFYFYKLKDQWIASQVTFNDQFQGLRDSP